MKDQLMIPAKRLLLIRRMICLFAALLTGLLSSTTSVIAQLKNDPNTRPIVLAYIPAYKPIPVDALPYDKLTHICHAFATASPQGTFTIGQYMPTPQLITKAHAHGVKVLLSLGGANSDHLLAPVAADDAKLSAFVDRVIDFMLKEQYDGIDVDWEFPESKPSAEGFIRLAQALHRKLEALKQQTGRHYIMSRAVAGGWAYRHIPTDIFLDNFDFINVMGYDCAGPWLDIAAHHSPITPASQATDKPITTVTMLLNHWLVERGIPASKLVLGLPAYGRGFKNARLYEPVKKTPSIHTTYTYRELMQRVKQGWAIRHLDNAEAWLIAPDHSEIIGFDDTATITTKCHWAQQLGLAGVFFWEGTQDIMPDGTTPLLDAAALAVTAWSSK